MVGAAVGCATNDIARLGKVNEAARLGWVINDGVRLRVSDGDLNIADSEIGAIDASAQSAAISDRAARCALLALFSVRFMGITPYFYRLWRFYTYSPTSVAGCGPKKQEFLRE